MGNKASSPIELSDKDFAARKEEKRKKEIEQRGVLVPPTLLCSHGSSVPPFSLPPETSSPSLYEYLGCTYLGSRLLNDFVTPGLSVRANSALDSRVHALWNWKDNPASALCATKHFSNGNCLEARFPFQGLPRLSFLSGGTNFRIFSTVNTMEEGWLGGEVATNTTSLSANQDSVGFNLGSWVDLEGRAKLGSIGGYAFVDWAGTSQVLAEAKLPSVGAHPEISTHVSVDLKANDEDPSLWLTVRRDPKQLSMNLSQVIVFDRKVVNVMEDRAPQVRNSLGWTLQMEKPSSAAADAPSTFSCAATWQLNRGLALKAVGNSKQCLTSGVILKRWKEPRVTCSVLYSYNMLKRQGGFVGIGLELDTGFMSPEASHYYPGPRGLVSTETPETKAVLPGEDDN